MAIFDSFRKKKPEDRSEEKRATPPIGRLAPRKWQVGDKIENRYEIHHIFGGPGKSGMGIVYVCYDHQFKKPVAVKTLQDQFLTDRATMERFKWEAKTWVRLEKHCNIVQAQYVDKIEGRPYIFLEYIVGDEQYGVDLSGWIWGGGLERDAKPDIPLILNFAIQFCHGMIYAQSKFAEMGKPFVHRDIKPQNIMVTRGRVVKITDFGLVKAFAEASEDIPSITVGDEFRKRLSLSKSGNICGTPPYMSPEQCRGEKDIDVRSDIYAFGCVLYEMLTQRYVFDAQTPQEFIKHHRKTRPKSPETHKELDKVVMKCLEKEPDKRYQDFNELGKVLSGVYHELTGKVIELPEAAALKAQELDNKVFSLMSLGFYQEGIDCCQQAVRLNPNDACAHRNLGVAYQAQGKLDEAIGEYREALRINPNLTEVHISLGLAYRAQGKLNEAVGEYREALRINPNLTAAHISLGVAYVARRKHDEAIREYREALRINPNYALAHRNLGAVYEALGKHDEAIREYREALRINPNYALAHRNLGAVYEALGEHDEAIRELEEALRIDPNDAEAHVNLELLLEVQGKLDEMIKEYREVLRINPNAAAHFNLATAYGIQGKLDEMIKEYREVLKIDPDFAEAHFNLGGVYETVGKVKEAIASYQTFIKLVSPQYAARISEAEENIRRLKQKI